MLRSTSLPKREWSGILVGDVRINSVLNESPSAVVLLGRQEIIGRPAVVKLLPFSGDERCLAEQSILKNAQALSQLRHANITTLYDMGLFEGRYPYLVMEYIAGGTLRHLVELDAPIDPLRALSMMQQLAHALEDVHRIGLVHQNLNLDNILVESLAGSGHDLVKLTNFGLSSGFDPNHSRESGATKVKTALLTTPEGVLGEDFSPQGDIYLCGMMLYELLTGSTPYTVNSLPDLWDEIAGGTPSTLGEHNQELVIYPELQTLIERMLAKNPNSRPSARALRLMIGQVIVDIEQKDAAVVMRPGFPVLNTVERLPILPRQAGSAAGSTEAEAKEWLDLIEVDKIGFDNNFRQTTQVRNSLLQLMDLTNDKIEWSAPRPENLSSAGDDPYLVMVVSNPSGQLPPGLTTKMHLLLSSNVDASTGLVVFTIPNLKQGWLVWLKTQASQYGLRVGLAFGKRFDAIRRSPADYTLKSAVEATLIAEDTDIIAARHAVDALSMSKVFESLSHHTAGRSSSFMKYTGLKGSD